MTKTPRVRNRVMVVGRRGQITLGKEYAGRLVSVEQKELGVWIVRTGTLVPDSERWLHSSIVSAAVQRGFASLSSGPPADRLDDLEKLIGGDQQLKE